MTSANPNMNLQIPEPKWPLVYDGQWEPYGSEEEYFAHLSAAAPGSAIKQAILHLEGSQEGEGAVAEALKLMSKAKDEFDANAKEDYFRRARAFLMEVLMSSENNSTFAAIEAAMPTVLSAADRKDDEVGLSDDRAVWRFRLLYNLTLGIHKGLLSSANWQENSAAAS